MADFKGLIALITDEVEKFNKQIPGIQQQMLEDVQLLVKKLELNGKTIKTTGANLKILSQIKNKLQGVILNPQYVDSTKDFVSNFDKIVQLQNAYFTSVESKFTPPKVTKQITEEARKSVANQLTENGLAANVTDKVYEMLRHATTGGGNFTSMNKQLTDFIVNNSAGDGQLLKYTRQITTDALNNFSGTYTQIISSDLGFEWFRYSGANIETTRPFCLGCRQHQWFHISELPKVIKGDFPEFAEFDGKINPKTKLPNGMVPGTDVTNFQIYRGGYNCGHQWRPGSAELVPKDIQDRVYATPEYAAWATAHGKKVPEIKPAPKPEPKEKSKELPVNVKKLMSGGFGKLKKNEVVRSILDNEHKELSQDEKVAVFGYTQDEYHGLNAYLRKARKGDPYLDNYKNILNNALDKMDSTHPGPVFRGVDLDADSLKPYVDAFNNGASITHDYFTSTSKSQSAAFSGNTKFTIVSKNGKSVEKISGIAKEKEVLFKAGTQFKVTGMEQKFLGDDKEVLLSTYLRLEEI